MAAVSQELTYDSIASAADAECLSIMGGLYEDGGTLILLGPGTGFWPHFRTSSEMQDGAPHPVDRWSTRVLGALADTLNAEAIFPFGGPPYQPFLRWAMATGRAWQSPAGMLVHDEAGLMVSYRGALRWDAKIALSAPPDAPPCVTCDGQPCMTACPVDALSAETGYDVAACHAYLDTEAGQDCMTQGCRARRACPVSQRFDRAPEQSALHMQSFHPVGRPT
ncbi:ferredoxin [Pseudohalocynthiibacter aestuariivivens]|nr:ferredoxin [Pseudohalocynthiibacter aestuariivivens]QIE46668.1 ferredoxin [Pseudohalocynthiibacter aestuariivivens]